MLPSSSSSSSLSRSTPSDVSSTLTSLAESAQYGPALKLIVERAFYQSYPAVLQQNIAVKDERIKQICHEHYLEFLASIDHLMTVKGEMAELKGSVRALNEEVQGSAVSLIKAATSVNDMRRQRLRINEARDLVRQGQYLIQLTHKCNQQIHKRKFFSAVKVTSTLPAALHCRLHAPPHRSPRAELPLFPCPLPVQTLDQLQRVYLPRFAEYDFAKQLGQWRAALRQRRPHLSLRAVLTTSPLCSAVRRAGAASVCVPHQVCRSCGVLHLAELHPRA